MDQNCKLWVRSIWAKIQKFEGFLKQCLFYLGAASDHFSKIKQYLGEFSPKKPKRGPFMDGESIKKL